ncbi:MAG: response regulator transcription factor, partial [Actinomycetota bacterium]|nr:response regulator transcription factor [Actinomycetota bacterium]
YRPDVCLVDIRMPGSGIAAAAEIAARVPEAAIVMLTAAPEEEHLFAALKAGATGYLLKDIPGGRLGDALLAVVRSEAALPRALVPRLIDEFRRLDHSGFRRALPRRSTLTTREWEVLECMRDGLSNRQIAQRLFLSEVTVRRHAGSILKKLHVKSRGEAVELANSVQEI